jgi:hypothetical protein
VSSGCLSLLGHLASFPAYLIQSSDRDLKCSCLFSSLSSLLHSVLHETRDLPRSFASLLNYQHLEY